MNLKERAIPITVKTFTVIAITFLTSSSVWGLATEEFGDKPIRPQTEWPEGTTIVVQLPGRVYSSWINGNENFYYRGDTDSFNKFLGKFAHIKAPIHQLIVQRDRGKVKSLDGQKTMQFDWQLHVPSGIYRGLLIREKGEDTKEIYPSLTVFLGSRRFDFEDVILPENVEVVPSEDIKKNALLLKKIEEAKKWRVAKNKWLEFVEPYLEQVRKKTKDILKLEEAPSINYVEVRSGSISKFLPDYKIYIIESNITSVSKLFAVSSEGEIIDLGSGSFKSIDPRKEPFRNEAFSEFFKKQQMKVNNANTAMEIGKLIEEIAFAPGRWMFLKTNTKNFTIFKMGVFYNPGTYWLRDWQWYAERKENHWIVSRHYIGPPSMIGAPRRWKLAVDEEGRIIEVMH